MGLLPAAWRETLKLRGFGLLKVPMLFYARPRVLALSDAHIVVSVPFRRRNRNHLGSMYFGALCIGADCAVGALALHHIRAGGVPVSLIFKDMQAEFHKRAEGEVHFICEQGREIAALVARAGASEERVTQSFTVTATVPSLDHEPVATFKLTLSLKRRG